MTGRSVRCPGGHGCCARGRGGDRAGYRSWKAPGLKRWRRADSRGADYRIAAISRSPGFPAPDTGTPGIAGRSGHSTAGSADGWVQAPQRISQVGGPAALDVLAGVHPSTRIHALLALVGGPRVPACHDARSSLLDAEAFGRPVLARFAGLLVGFLLRLDVLGEGGRH